MRKATNKNNINFDKYQHLSIKVEKVEDTKFDGEHPNGYNPGFKIDGCAVNLYLSNQHCCLFVDYGDRWFIPQKYKNKKNIKVMTYFIHSIQYIK